MIARERTFLKKSPLPRAPSSKDGLGELLGGEAASLREAPLPQPPSPEERLALGVSLSAELVPPESRCGCLLLGCGHGG